MKLPAIPGMDDFGGRGFHTARWDYGYTGGAPGEPLTKLGDKAIALIGIGASGLQCLPPLAVTGRDQTHTAMARTVGLPIAMACKLVLNNAIGDRGVLLPLKPAIHDPVLDELASNGVVFDEREVGA